jgi:hypothetical protein
MGSRRQDKLDLPWDNKFNGSRVYELALDGHNYPTWALDVKISLTFRGIMAALTPPVERDATFMDTYKYEALYIIQNHHHPDLKSKYVMEEETHSLWVALKGRYE